jgi:hypothetical protein
MANLLSQMRAGPDGVTVRIWEVPDAFEVIPDEAWVEQPPDPAAAHLLGLLAGTPPAPPPVAAAGGYTPPWAR